LHPSHHYYEPVKSDMNLSITAIMKIPFTEYIPDSCFLKERGLVGLEGKRQE